jgi:Zn-dependent peptidase ImmA (M78 family)/transcriptional regulator with XRE-family HTH domain
MESASGIGARIRELRERAGIQSQVLAARLGLDPSAMSNIESGKRALKSSELASIATILGVSPLAILSEDSLLAALPIAARAQSDAVSVSSALARLTALAELHQVLTDQGIAASPALDDVPAVNLEDWLHSANTVAAWARDYLPSRGQVSPGQVPLDRFARIAEVIERNLGVDVLVEDYPSNEIHGASITDRRFPFILINRNQPLSRALFTLAHELGHVLSGQGEQLITLDVTLAQHTPSEMFANAFAAAFLMPMSDIQAIIDVDHLSSKAYARMLTEFRVSFATLVYRLHNLGYISAARRDRLRDRGLTAVLTDLDPEEQRRALGRQGMRPGRRPPGPLVLRTYQGYQQGGVSVRPLAGLLGIDPDELLAQLVRHQDSQDALEDGYAAEVVSSDAERYSGNPV